MTESVEEGGVLAVRWLAAQGRTWGIDGDVKWPDMARPPVLPSTSWVAVIVATQNTAKQNTKHNHKKYKYKQI